MNKTLPWGVAIAVVQTAMALVPNTTAPNDLLKYYSGDFTDTDGDGMTDVYEEKYGYDPNDAESFPLVDFVAPDAEDEVGAPIDSYEFMKLEVFEGMSGISLKWNDVDPTSSFNRYSLTLEDGNRTLYYGGHGWDSADINFENFELDGSEVLRGKFTEADTSNGEVIKEHPWFEIDLSDYSIPPPDSNLGEDTDKVQFEFIGFSDEQEEQYVDFMRRLIPIINDVVGNPAESFVCEFIMNEESSNSWVTYDHGRVIELDSNWNPRLLVHEMIHMWDGKYGFTWSGENREYEDDFSGFAEVAEGVAYKILHEFVMAYPNHSVSYDTITGGAWKNWSSNAWSFDLYKHQRFTGGGMFWTGDLRAVDYRYSTVAMLVQAILVQNPNFLKDTRRELFDILNEDSTKILNRNEIVSLWARNIETINGIDTTKFLNAMPVLNGRKIDQGFYPIINIVSPVDVDIFSTYAVDGMFWWHFITPENIDSFNVPSWVKHNLNNDDGYYYVDTNDMAFSLNVKNVFDESVQSLQSRSDNTYQDEEKVIPDTLGEVRISDEFDVAPSSFSQGLYVYNLSYTELASYTEDATEDFYFMGEKDIFQNEDEYVLTFGVDSKFAEKVIVKIPSSETSFELPVINGSAILKSSDIPLNWEEVLEIHVHSNDESFVYQRSLFLAGNSFGEFRQQYLIIDRDFDGLEDLYDEEVSNDFINQKYQSYLAKYPTHRNDTEDDDTGDDGGDDGGDDDDPTEWSFAEDHGAGWRGFDWFGYYFDTASNWIYHLNLGWLYRVSDKTDSIWLWDSSLGWLWTSSGEYPFLYSHSRKGWLYYAKNVSPVYFWDFNASEWFAR